MLEIEAKHTGRPPEIIRADDTRIITRTQAAKDVEAGFPALLTVRSLPLVLVCVFYIVNA